MDEADDATGQLERGATYFIADGNYSAYTFDDDEQNDSDGNPLYITIKKAVHAGEHGTNVGWNSDMGDEQAVFIGDTGEHAAGYDQVWRILKSYYIFDGQVGGGPDDWKGETTPLGFKVSGVADKDFRTNTMLVMIGYQWYGPIQPHDIEIRHAEITCRPYCEEDVHDWIGNKTAPSYLLRGGYHSASGNYGGATDVIISNCYIHHAHVLVWNSNVDNWIFEYNCFAEAAPGNYPIGTQSDGTKVYSCSNMIYRYNYWENCASGTAAMAFPSCDKDYYDNCHFKNISVYGSVFYNDDDNVGGDLGTSGAGTIGFYPSAYQFDDSLTDIYIYNNAFVNIKDNFYHGGGRSGIYTYDGFDSINNFQVKNNLFYKMQQEHGDKEDFIYGPTESDYNWFYNCTCHGVDQAAWLAANESHGQKGTADPFVDWVNEDFHLNASTANGIFLPAPYNQDMFGIERGADENWDRGAIEFVESPPVYYVRSGATGNNDGSDWDNAWQDLNNAQDQI